MDRSLLVGNRLVLFKFAISQSGIIPYISTSLFSLVRLGQIFISKSATEKSSDEETQDRRSDKPEKCAPRCARKGWCWKIR